MNSQEPLDARPRTMKEICAYYGLSYKTMRNMLINAGYAALVVKKGTGAYYYTIFELQQIMRAISTEN